MASAVTQVLVWHPCRICARMSSPFRKHGSVRQCGPPEISGYRAYFNNSARPGLWGVATYVRHEPTTVNNAVLDHPRFTSEGRAQLLTWPSLAVLNVYMPHGGRDGHDLVYKLEVLTLLAEFLFAWDGQPIILVGDLNIARTSQDLARPLQNQARTMFTEAERGLLESILDIGLVDAVRHQSPSASALYTWWPYAYSARKRNVGWRIDYVLVHSSLAEGIRYAEHLTDVDGSDHCPVRVVLDHPLPRENGDRVGVRWAGSRNQASDYTA